MKKQLVVVLLMLGTACAARAQVAVPDPKGTDRNVAADFSAASAASATVLRACDTFTISAGALRRSTGFSFCAREHGGMMPLRHRRPIRNLYTAGGTTSAGSSELALIG